MPHANRQNTPISLDAPNPVGALQGSQSSLTGTNLIQPLSSRDRILATLQGRVTDVVPAVPAYLCITLDQEYAAGYIRSWRSHLEGAERTQFNHERDTEIRAHALMAAYQTLGRLPDWIEVPLGLTRAQSNDVFLQTVGDGLLFSGPISGPLNYSADSCGLPGNHMLYRATSGVFYNAHVKGGGIHSVADVDSLFPALSIDGLVEGGAFDLPTCIATRHGARHCLVTVMNTPYSFAYSLLGFESLMLMQMYDRHLLHKVLERSLDRAVTMISALKAVGVHGVYFQEVMSGADAISHVAFEEYSLRYLRPILKHAAAEGLFSVLYFSGKSLPRLEALASLELSALALEEGKKGFKVPIEEVVRRVGGQMAILGNVDVVDPYGPASSAVAIREEVFRQAEIGLGAKGFISSTGSPFLPETDRTVIDAFLEASHELSNRRS